MAFFSQSWTSSSLASSASRATQDARSVSHPQGLKSSSELRSLKKYLASRADEFVSSLLWSRKDSDSPIIPSRYMRRRFRTVVWTLLLNVSLSNTSFLLAWLYGEQRMVYLDLLWRAAPRDARLLYLENWGLPVQRAWSLLMDSWSTLVSQHTISSTQLCAMSCCARVSLELRSRLCFQRRERKNRSLFLMLYLSWNRKKRCQLLSQWLRFSLLRPLRYITTPAFQLLHRSRLCREGCRR